MDRIREWMEANPEEGEELRRKNRSYVFFEETDLGANDECIGSQGVPLTARALARGRPVHPRLRHADLGRGGVADRAEEAGERRSTI